MTRRNPEVDSLTRENDELRRQLAELRRDPGDLPVTGCGDTSCVVATPQGMATNGGCRCDPHTVRQALQYWRRLARFRERTIQEMRTQGSAVVEALDKLTSGSFALEVRCTFPDHYISIKTISSREGGRYRVTRDRGDDSVATAPVATAQEAADVFAAWLRDAQEKTA